MLDLEVRRSFSAEALRTLSGTARHAQDQGAPAGGRRCANPPPHILERG